MNSLTVFQFESQDVRCVETENGMEWVAADVCRIFGIGNPSQALSDFEDSEKGFAPIISNDITRQMLTVKEPGLYRLIFQSKKPVAKRFQKWVFEEVLPQIRKTGSYSFQNQSRQDSQSWTQILLSLHQLGESRQTRALHQIIDSTIASYPSKADELNQIKQQYPLMSFEDEMINPDALLEKAIALNVIHGKATRHDLQMMLIHNGFQIENLVVDLSVKHDKPFAGAESSQHMFGDSYYLPTEKGAKFSKMVDYGKRIRNSDKTKELFWHPSVLNHLTIKKLVTPSYYSLASVN